MTLTMLALTALRAAVVLGIALVAVRVLSRAPAATRRFVLVGATIVVLALPLVTAMLPALHLRSAEPATELLAATSLDDAIEETALVSAAAPLAPIAHTTEQPRPLPAEPPLRISAVSVLLALWALGAAVVLARLGLGLVRARRLVASARVVETHDVGSCTVEIRVCDTIDMPAVTGVITPVVLLPPDASTWTAERRRVVVAHELAHVESHDCLTNVLAQLAVAMHWFNPLVWLVARRLRLERELAADERVVSEAAVPPSIYAEHLLALATCSPARPTATLAVAEPSLLAVRIGALLEQPPRRRLGRTRFALLAASLALVAVVACATPEREAMTAQAQTLDPAAQRIVEEEIDRMNKEWSPCAAIILVLDPRTGHVVAAAHRGGTESTVELAAARPLAAGSTIKPLVVAAALEEGAIKPTDTFDASPIPFSAIVDAKPNGTLDVGEILAVSSNVGLAKIYDNLGGAKLATWTKRFHLASAPSTIPDGAAGALVATGAKIRSTPLEVAAAFAVLADGGVYHAPTFVPRTGDSERVLRAETAATVLELLEGVTGDGGTGKAARVAGVRVAGKTGTAHLGSGVDSTDLYASFVGTAPLDHPRYVIFVGAETPRDGGSGGQVAAPAFSRVMARLLAP